jgi:hypothetical protein
MAGKVQKGTFTGRMNLAHGELERLVPLPKPVAKGTVLVGVGAMLTLVLIPQKLQRDIGALELAVQVAVIWLDELGPAYGGRFVDACAELVITEFVGRLPVQTRQAGCLGDVANAGLGDVKSRRNLAGAEVSVVQKLKDLSLFTHRDPWCGHKLGSGRKTGELMPG